MQTPVVVELFLSPEGKSAWSNCFTCVPRPKGTEGGSIVFTYVLFWVSKTLEAFQFMGGFLPKKIPENVLFDGTDGRVGRTGGTVIHVSFRRFGSKS